MLETIQFVFLVPGWLVKTNGSDMQAEKHQFMPSNDHGGTIEETQAYKHMAMSTWFTQRK